MDGCVFCAASLAEIDFGFDPVNDPFTFSKTIFGMRFPVVGSVCYKYCPENGGLYVFEDGHCIFVLVLITEQSYQTIVVLDFKTIGYYYMTLVRNSDNSLFWNQNTAFKNFRNKVIISGRDQKDSFSLYKVAVTRCRVTVIVLAP